MDWSITEKRRFFIAGPAVIKKLVSIMLSMLFERFHADGNQKIFALLEKISPIAWQHIHFLGHYAFRDKKSMIDLEAMLANVSLE